MSETQTPPSTNEGMSSPGSDQVDVPEKFRNEDGSVNVNLLSQSYKELEQRLGSSTNSDANQTQQAPSTQQTQAPAVQQTQPPSTESDDRPNYEQQLDPFYKSFEENGKLSDEEYDQLQALGYPKNLVDSYIDMTRNTVEQHTKMLIDKAGGQDAFDMKVRWASQNWSPEQLEAFDRQVQSHKPEAREMAINNLIDEYTRVNGTDSQRLHGAVDTGVSGVQPYASEEEMRRDMKDPKYQSDPAFRAAVARRYAAMQGRDPSTIRVA